MKTIEDWIKKLPWQINQDLTHEDVIRLKVWAKDIQQDAVRSCRNRTSSNGMDKKIKNLIGKDVYINWNDATDWYTFKVLSIDFPNVRLQGIEDMDGTSYESTPLTVDVDDIENIREIGPKYSSN